MSEQGRYPFLPEDFHGYVFERDGHRYRVAWPHVGSVATLTPDAPDILQDIRVALIAATKDNGASVVDFVHEMEAAGFSFVGLSSFDFRSGTLFWHAHTLLRMAHSAEERRQAILVRRAGREPGEGDDDWQEWMTACLQAGSCATGARLLGYASLETFVNEVLYVNFPAIYESYESRTGASRRVPFASMPDKVARLLKELELQTDADWLQRIRDDAPIRRGIEHHKLKADFTEPIGDLDSLGYSDGASPDEVQGFLDDVQAAFQTVHDAFEIDLPPTHRPPQ